MTEAEWTEADLALIQSLDAAGAGVEEIARQLRRAPAAIEERLTIVRDRAGAVPAARPDHNEDQDWYGPDEEGDVPPARDPGDVAAWVHGRPDIPR